MLKISHYNTFYFLRQKHLRYVKSFFTNIRKQQNILKISLLFKKFTNFSRILSINNAKFSGYYFYINTNIQVDFQICVRVPLMKAFLLVEAAPFSRKLILLVEAIPLGQNISCIENIACNGSHSIQQRSLLLAETIPFGGSCSFQWKLFLLVETISFSTRHSFQ